MHHSGGWGSTDGRHSVTTRRVLVALVGLAFLAIAWFLVTGGLPGGGQKANALAVGQPLPPAPDPTNLSSYVTNRQAALQLGKALFWDMQAGSDGVTACASCHFAAGADTRSRNTMNPGAGGGGFSPNRQLSAGDFPNNSGTVVGSQGVNPATFTGITPGHFADDQTPATPDSTFSSGGINVRRVTGRNTPSVINAVFNHRNFWDGRAQNHFNGVTPFGNRDQGARIATWDGNNLSLTQVPADDLNDASLASQAVGPPGNPVEMSADGRSLRDIGKKLLSLRPLERQRVDPTDSVLGPLADPSGKGLNTSYDSLIRAAFQPRLWAGNQLVQVQLLHRYMKTH